MIAPVVIQTCRRCGTGSTTALCPVCGPVGDTRGCLVGEAFGLALFLASMAYLFGGVACR